MGRTLNINWEEVKNISDEFKNNSNELREISNDLKSSFSNVSISWIGNDSKNYVSKNQELIDNLNTEANYIELWGDFLFKSSIKYNENTEEYVNTLKKIDSDYDDVKV